MWVFDFGNDDQEKLCLEEKDEGNLTFNEIPIDNDFYTILFCPSNTKETFSLLDLLTLVLKIN